MHRILILTQENFILRSLLRFRPIRSLSDRFHLIIPLLSLSYNNTAADTMNEEFQSGAASSAKAKKASKKILSTSSKSALNKAKAKATATPTFLSTQPTPSTSTAQMDEEFGEGNDEFERFPLDYSGKGQGPVVNTTGIKRRVAAVLAAAAASSMEIDTPSDEEEEDDSAILIDPSALSSSRPTPVTRLPAAQVQAMSGLLSFPAVSHTSTSGLTQRRKVSIPPHRMTPLKRDWVKVYGPLVEELGLQVRMNLGRRWVELKVRLVVLSSLFFLYLSRGGAQSVD